VQAAEQGAEDRERAAGPVRTDTVNEVRDQHPAIVQGRHGGGAAFGREAGRGKVTQDCRVALDRVDRALRWEDPHHPRRSVAALDPEHVPVQFGDALDAGAVRGLEMPDDLACGKTHPANDSHHA
jgi:hypothetical protein